MYITVLLCTISCLIIILKSVLPYIYNLRRLPRGPIPIPFYGNRMPKDIHPGLCQWYRDLCTEYGNIFTIYQGAKPTIVVNGFEAVSELLINNGSIVHTRPVGEGVLSFLHDNSGLVWNNQSYKSMRKISSITLKSSINSCASASNDKLRDILETLDGCTIDLAAPMRELVSDNICSAIFGVENREKFSKIMELHYGSLQGVSKIDYVMRIPLLKYVPGFSANWESSIAGKERFKKLLGEILEDSKKFPSDKMCENFFDTFIRHSCMQKTSQLGVEDCFATVMQLMLAGVDAVHGGLMWLFLYITINQKVQQRMAEEIISEIGLDSTPSQKHIPNMPYCMAVIYETIRVSNVAFTSLPYTNQQEVSIRGTTIPANSSITVNIVSINKDPAIFPEPEAFIPERFIDKEGKLKNIPQFSPFSIGRRACIGEWFSKTMIFVTMVTTLQKYKLVNIPEQNYSTTAAKGFLSAPDAYKLKLVPRRNDNTLEGFQPLLL